MQAGFVVHRRLPHTKAPGDLAVHSSWNGDGFTDGQIIDTVTPRHGGTRVNDPALRAEPVWNSEEHPRAWRAIWAYSANGHAVIRKPWTPKKPAPGDRRRREQSQIGPVRHRPRR